MAMYLPIATNLFHYISVSPKQLTVTQLVGCGFAVIGSGTVVVGCAVVVVGCGVVNSKQTFIEFSTSVETINMTVQRDVQLASSCQRNSRDHSIFSGHLSSSLDYVIHE